MIWAIGRRAAAPAEVFHAAAVRDALRRSGINKPSALNAAALRAIAPIFRGSVTPSTAMKSAGSDARAKISFWDEYWNGFTTKATPGD